MIGFGTYFILNIYIYIYINDLPYISKHLKTILYADDTNLIFSINTLSRFNIIDT